MLLRRFAQRAGRSLSTRASPLNAFTEEQVALRDAVRKFGQDVIAPLVPQMDKEAKMDPSVFKGLFDLGLMAVDVPEEHGGSGMDFTSTIIAIEELAVVDPAVSVAMDVQNTLVTNFFRNFATPDLRDRYLPRLSANLIGSFCLSESGSGSDAFALKTRANPGSQNGVQGYTLSGEKMWITNAREAGVFIVLANVDFSKAHRGITAFVVDGENPGLSVGQPEDKLGIRASSTCAVTLSECFVPSENILGEIGSGYKYAIGTLNEGRIGIAAQMLGLARGALRVSVPYLRERRQFGTAIADFQGVQHQIAQMETEVEAAANLVYNAARLKENGAGFVREAAMAKLYASQVADRVTSRCVELLGGVGFTRDFPAEKFYRDVKIGAIYEGTSNIQLNTIAKLSMDLYD